MTKNPCERRCWTCGNVAMHADDIAPDVCCQKCGSQDTRRTKPSAADQKLTKRQEFEQIGQLLARCVSGGMIVEISPTQDHGFWVWIGLLENGGEHTGIANKSGKTLWDALISAVEAAEQGVGE